VTLWCRHVSTILHVFSFGQRTSTENFRLQGRRLCSARTWRQSRRDARTKPSSAKANARARPYRSITRAQIGWMRRIANFREGRPAGPLMSHCHGALPHWGRRTAGGLVLDALAGLPVAHQHTCFASLQGRLLDSATQNCLLFLLTGERKEERLHAHPRQHVGTARHRQCQEQALLPRLYTLHAELEQASLTSRVPLASYICSTRNQVRRVKS